MPRKHAKSSRKQGIVKNIPDNLPEIEVINIWIDNIRKMAEENKRKEGIERCIPLFMFSVIFDDIDYTKQFLRKYSSKIERKNLVNLKDSHGRYIIFYAVFNNSWKTTKFLLENGFDIGKFDKEGKEYNILHYASFSANTQMFEIIFSHISYLK